MIVVPRSTAADRCKATGSSGMSGTQDICSVTSSMLVLYAPWEAVCPPSSKVSWETESLHWVRLGILGRVAETWNPWNPGF